jgi:hypothetical protein
LSSGALLDSDVQSADGGGKHKQVLPSSVVFSPDFLINKREMSDSSTLIRLFFGSFVASRSANSVKRSSATVIRLCVVMLRKGGFSASLTETHAAQLGAEHNKPIRSKSRQKMMSLAERKISLCSFI